MKLDSSEDLRHELTALNDWFLCEFDRLHSAWLQTDSDDKTWLNTLLDQWRAKHKAFMLPHTNNFTAKDVELLDTQECVIEYPELWAAAKELFPTADDATLTKIISFGFAMRHNWRREYNDYD